MAEGLSVRAVEEMVALGEGGEERPRRSPAALRAPDPRHEELCRQLGDRFETRVRIDGGRESGQKRGRIVIEFADAEDLERIAAELISRFIDISS